MKILFISITYGIFLISLGQKIDKANFDYVEVIDQNWDSVAYEGSLKLNDIIVPECKLTEVEIDFDETIEGIIQEEVYRKIGDLKAIYSDIGDLKDLDIAFVDQVCYRFGEATLAVFEHSVNYEYTKVLTFLIIDENKNILYSRVNKLGLEIDIKCVKKIKESYVVFGNSQANPEFSCGGVFKLIFEKDKRILKYSYCEEKN